MLLWRHGQTSWNAERRFQGQQDVDLDQVGVRQAELSSALLARLRPDRLVSSDLRRARATAGALARRTGLTVTCDPRYRELYAGSWEGLLASEIEQRWPEQRRAWAAGENVRPGDDGELRTEVGRRVADAVLEHLAEVPEDGLLVVATHGGAAKAGLLTLMQVPEDRWDTLSGLSNCCWSLVERRASGRWVLAEHNAGSLPQEVLGDEE